MITLTDMQKALAAALEKKSEQQVRLRKAANELVQTYRDSLQIDTSKVKKADEIVQTGELTDGNYSRVPVSAIELGQDGTLSFIITTVLDGHTVNKFVISVSIAMREHDDNLSVHLDDEPLPMLVLAEGAEGRFYEVVERIKVATLAKIERHL